MNNQVEITFHKSGNTVVGGYFDYLSLDVAISKKPSILFPEGFSVSGEKSDIVRLADYVLTFGNVMQTKESWNNAVRLSGCNNLGWK